MDERARNELVLEHLPLVHSAARQFVAKLPASIELDDLVQSGTLGLIDAAEKFDASRGLKFKTYAEFRIRGTMLDFLREGDWMPRSTRDKLKALEGAKSELRGSLGREPEMGEIAAALGIDLNELHGTVEASAPRTLVYDSDELTRADKAALASLATAPDEGEERLLFSEYLEGRDLQVVELYVEGLPMWMIGSRLGLTEGRISQLVRKCTKWMRVCVEAGVKRVKRCEMPQVKDGLVGTAEAAEILGCSIMSISNWVRDGFLTPALTDGRMKFFKMTDLDGIRVLRTKYGKAWTKHIEGHETEEEDDDVDEFAEQNGLDEADEDVVLEEVLEFDREAFCRRMIGRARKAHEAGQETLSCFILWSVVEEWFDEAMPDFAKKVA